MKSYPSKILVALAFLFIGFNAQSQIVVNTSTSSQVCVDDTITVNFSVSSAFNAGNNFGVELYNPSNPGFTPIQIEITPRLAFNIGSYTIDCYIPITVPQGGYSVRVTATNPLSYSSDTVNNIIIGQLPNTDITVFDAFYVNNVARFCTGDTVLLRGPQPPVGETYSYQWFESGAPLGGETDDTLMVIATGAYSIRVTVGLCDDISVDTLINEYTPPTNINANPANPGDMFSYQTVDTVRMCEGNTARVFGPLNFSQGTGVAYTYEWLSDSINGLGQRIFYPIAGDTSNLLIDSNVRLFLRVMDNVGGCEDTSDAYWVVVDSIPDLDIQAVPWPGQTIAQLDLCPEDSVMLSATDTIFDKEWSYQWEIEVPLNSGNWVSLPNDTLPWLQVDTNLIADSAKYRLSITNYSCSYIGNEIQVNIVPKPFFTIFPSDSIAICEGDSVLAVLQGNALQYRWDGGLYIGSSRWMTDDGRYVIEGVGINGCSYFDTLDVTYNIVNANAGGLYQVKEGESVQLNGSGGVSYYWYADRPVEWDNPFSQNPQVTVKESNTKLILQVTGPNGCVGYDTAYVTFVQQSTPSDDVYNNIQNGLTPNDDGINDVLDLSNIMATITTPINLAVLNRYGAEVFRVDDYQNDWAGTNNAGDVLPDGTYYIIIVTDNNVIYKGAVTLLRNQ